MSQPKVLGQKVSYPQIYDPSVLERQEREINRKDYLITGKEFIGYDVWNCYEISFLLESGMPVACVGKIVYPSHNQYIVESKSLKLYLNSFNMTKFRGNVSSCIDQVTEVISRDLSSLLEISVDVNLFLNTPHQEICPVFPLFLTPLENQYHLEDIHPTSYTESPDVLKGKENGGLTRQNFFTCLLRSNCKVTKQPDWGNLYVMINSSYWINPESFLEYIVSFRNENHFHEEVVEMIYKRLLDKFHPEELMVAAIYTRRGGIDICPIRATHVSLLDKHLINSSKLTEKTLRQ